VVNQILHAIALDLTHTLSEQSPSWEGTPGFKSHTLLDYQDCSGDVRFKVQSITMRSGIGTHIDAPAHCIPGGASIDMLNLCTLIAPCIVIDVSARSSERYAASQEDIELFEQQYGRIEEKSLVIIRTGWDRFWENPTKYRNDLVFPTLSEKAATYLLNRNIVGLGIDTLGPDLPENGFTVHKLLLGHGCYIIENVANAEALPPKGSISIALPIKIQDGTEAPLRLVALKPKI
jgi:kynurenine formamidase